MICYNQEKYIRIALDSVLCEEVKPYEIIIGDDFSTDGTRNILLEYKNRYPEILKLVFNEKNLGIVANANNVAPKATGDVIHFLSGDDWFRPKFLANMNKKIFDLNIDPHTVRFILVPHTVYHYVDSTEKTIRNNPKLIEQFSPVGLLFRGMLFHRQVGLSRALFDRWPLFPSDSDDIGLWADLVQLAMLTQHVETIAIIDSEGPVYRAGVGIVSKAKSSELARSYHAALVRIHSYSLSGDIRLNSADAQYLEFLIDCWSVFLGKNQKTIIAIIREAFVLIYNNIREIRPIAKLFFYLLRRTIVRLIKPSL